MEIIHADCVEAMAGMEPNSVYAIVTDPPYGLKFMGKGWDHGVPVDWIEPALRVLKPGGHLLAFGGTRTYHRLTCAIEDAGFEIRDCLCWLYGSGFPKSLDVSKAIDKAAGVERERGPMKRGGERLERLEDGKRAGNGTWGDESGRDPYTSEPATEAAREWQGWGTALKPAHEPIVLARKPISEKNIAANVLKWGTGAINVDGCRVEAGQDHVDKCQSVVGLSSDRNRTVYSKWNGPRTDASGKGRWPANLILDPEAARLLDEQSGELTSGKLETHHKKPTNSPIGTFAIRDRTGEPCDWGGDSGGASRFFYVAKPSTAEREGEDLPLLGVKKAPIVHPTMKPVELMRYLVRLVTPKGGIVLDPFMGSGTTGMAAGREGFDFIGIEREAEYVAVARARLGA